MSEQNHELMAILQKMQQQLTYLEKKLDTLLHQSQQKPFNREGNFSRPFRPARPHSPSGGHGHGHGHGQAHGNFAPKKKPYFGQQREH